MYLNYKDSYKDYKLNHGDILIARIGATFGKSYYFNESFKAVFAGYLIRIKLKDKMIIPKFLFYFLQTKYFWKQAKILAKGAAQPQFNANTLKDLLIPIPPIEIQNRVVEIMDEAYSQKKQKETEAQQLLDSINDYVLDELGIKLPELKDEMIYIVNYNEVKGKRIDAYYYQPKFEEVEKAVKKGKFEVKELKELLEYAKKGIEVGSKEYVNEGVPFVRVADIDDYKINLENTDKKITFELFEKIKEDYKPKRDEILYSKDGTIGFCVVVNEDKDFIISGGILRLKTKKEVNNLYLKTILSNSLFKLLAEKESIGAIIKHLTPDSLLSLKIPLPPISVQDKIAEEVKSRMQKAEQLKKEAKELLENAKEEIEKLILGE